MNCNTSKSALAVKFFIFLFQQVQKVSYVVLLMIYWDQKRKFWYNHLRTSTDFDANKFNPYFY